MQTAIIVDRNGSEKLDRYLRKGWVVTSMAPFHPAVSVSSNAHSYSDCTKVDTGAILVIIEDLDIPETPA